MLVAANIVSQSVWWHFLVINIPDKIEFTDSAFIYITGGDNRPYVLILLHHITCISNTAIFNFAMHVKCFSARAEVLRCQISLQLTVCFQQSLLSQLERKRMKNFLSNMLMMVTNQLLFYRVTATLFQIPNQPLLFSVSCNLLQYS